MERPLHRIASLLIPIALLGGRVAAGPVPSLAPPSPSLAADPAGAVVAAVPALYLHTQLDSPGGETSAWVSQNLEPAYNLYDSEAADDFTVPPGEVWMVDRLTVPGYYFAGSAGPMPMVDVRFYADAGGLPGGEISFQRVAPPTTDTAGDLTIDLDPDVELPRGTYWFSIVAFMDFDPLGQWAWNDRTVQSGNPAVWRNPADGFATGCVDWTPGSSCASYTGPDLLFAIEGEVRGEEACNSGVQPFEDPFPPSEWSTFALESGPGWSDLAGCGESNYTGGTGDAACVSSDDHGAGAFDARLVSPGFGMVDVQSAWVTFQVNYQNNVADALDLDISDDGELTWTNVVHWTEDLGHDTSTPGYAARVDLAPFVGRTGLVARWRYYNLNGGAWDWYAQIDDIGLHCVEFADGFESGDVCAWSSAVGPPPCPPD